jgi:hypothetical protein
MGQTVKVFGAVIVKKVGKIVTSKARDTRMPSQMPELSIGTVGTG